MGPAFAGITSRPNMSKPIKILPHDLELVFPDPREPLLPHATQDITWEQWMQECAERTNAYLRTYDRVNDPTLTRHAERFVLE